MKKLFNKSEYLSAKSTDKLPCLCYCCNNVFYKSKKEIKSFLNGNKKHTIQYCSRKCKNTSFTKTVIVNCSNCNIEVEKNPSDIKKTKSGKVFCSKSCAATYNNKNKTTGNRRSKLEIWLEDQLNELYPNLDILFNDKETISSELDIYIPSLKLAFELNGIFHYEPIYGENKLQQIQENDSNKFQLCQKNKISLCIIDTSKQKYVKPKTSKKYLDIITSIINKSNNVLNS